ncbi:MAG: 50S ribosomal protein L35 [Bacilli bacterium]|nr:50S ribosomal protein L35 [Bacilli bacterium]MDD4054014.1 50S ribosomal protein L35 [Bacilli bacterium]MDD4412004.1 50S ribosomal protein L35 [Bacilli bacterium]
MPKMKTHTGTKKVVNKRPGGTIAIGRSGGRHNTGKKSTAINRKKRAGAQLSKADERRIKSLI